MERLQQLGCPPETEAGGGLDASQGNPTVPLIFVPDAEVVPRDQAGLKLVETPTGLSRR